MSLCASVSSSVLYNHLLFIVQGSDASRSRQQNRFGDWSWSVLSRIPILFLEAEVIFRRSGSADQSGDGEVKVAVRE